MALVPPPQEYYEKWGHQVWVDPNSPGDAHCTHYPSLRPGHTTLYVIHDLYSDGVLYVGITSASHAESQESVHNVIGNKRVDAPRDPALVDCKTCGFAIQSNTDEYDDAVRTGDHQHYQCAMAIVDAYEAGIARTQLRGLGSGF